MIADSAVLKAQRSAVSRGDLVDRPVALRTIVERVALRVRGLTAAPRRRRSPPSKLVGEAPQPGQQSPVHAVDAGVRPGGILVGGADDQHVAARRVRSVGLDDLAWGDHVALRARHLDAVGAEDHALGEQGRERLLDVEQVHVRERLDEEARVHQVQDRVLDATDVLVDGHPAAQHLAVPRGLVVAGVAVAQVVPARVDERVHRVGLAASVAAAFRAPHVDPVLGRRQRRAALRLVVLDLGELDREVVLGDRDHAALLAVDDRDRAAPVALARDEPVAQLVTDREMALALAVEPLDDRLLGLDRVHPRELTRVDQNLVLGVGDERLAVGGLAPSGSLPCAGATTWRIGRSNAFAKS